MADERAGWDIEKGKCPQCHGDPATCSDPDLDWFPQRTVCEVTMSRAGAQRLYELLHEKRPYHDGRFTSWAEKASRSHPFHHSDGVSIWVSDVDLTPDDDFLSVGGGAKEGDGSNNQAANGEQDGRGTQ